VNQSPYPSPLCYVGSALFLGGLWFYLPVSVGVVVIYSACLWCQLCASKQGMDTCD